MKYKNEGPMKFNRTLESVNFANVIFNDAITYSYCIYVFIVPWYSNCFKSFKQFILTEDLYALSVQNDIKIYSVVLENTNQFIYVFFKICVLLIAQRLEEVKSFGP